MSILDRNDPTKTVGYAYNGYRRLKTTETAGTHWGLSWSYDRCGNRLSQAVTKGTAPANALTVDAAANRVDGWCTTLRETSWTTAPTRTRTTSTT